MSPESLPVRLRQGRGALSLAEAAARTGLSVARIRAYEEGERQPYGKTLRRLAQVYGLSPSELLELQPTRPRSEARQGTTAIRRRRRRRIAASPGNQVVEVPVEIAEGHSVRVVIELIVRPKPLEVSRTSAAAETRTALATGDAGPVEAPREPSSREPSRGPRRRIAAGSDAVGLAAAPKAAPELAPRTGDPMADIRRAYTEFRREKK